MADYELQQLNETKQYEEEIIASNFEKSKKIIYHNFQWLGDWKQQILTIFKNLNFETFHDLHSSPHLPNFSNY